MTDSNPLETPAKQGGNIIPNEAVRGYIYRVLVALVPILTVWGAVAETDAPLYLGLAAAFLGLPIAAFNTSVKKGN